MAATNPGKRGTKVVSALRARSKFGELIRSVDDDLKSAVKEKRGTPNAALLSIRDYAKLAAPEPAVLRLIGQESERNGASTLTWRQIDQIIKTSRSRKAKRVEPALSLSKGVPAPRGR